MIDSKLLNYLIMFHRMFVVLMESRKFFRMLTQKKKEFEEDFYSIQLLSIGLIHN